MLLMGYSYLDTPQHIRFLYGIFKKRKVKRMSVIMENNHKVENPFKDWVPLDEAATKIGWSRTAVTYWADQGYIACFQVGQRIRVVNIEEVKSYAEERKNNRKHNRRRVHPKRKNADPT